MKTYKACFFDLYGTLADIHTDESKPAFWKKVAWFYSEHGAAWAGPELRREYLRLCAEAEAELMAAAPTDACVEIELIDVFAALYRQCGVTPEPALLDRTARFFRRESTTHLRAYAGARELLCGLRTRGARVVLLSNAQSSFTRPELDDLNLTDCFDRIFISSEVGRKKPDPAFFRTALKEMDLRPEECLMIGNDPVCDVAGALSVGLDAVYIRSALSPKTPDPEQGEVIGRGAGPQKPRLILTLPKMDLPKLSRLLRRRI